MENVNIVNCQIVLFNCKNIILSEIEKDFRFNFDEIFDILKYTNINEESVPSELQVLELGSKSNIYSVVITKDKFLFNLNSKEDESLTFGALEQYFRKIKQNFKNLNMKFYRFGLIVNAYKKDDNPADLIKAKYMSQDKKYTELLLRYNVPFRENGKNYNEVVNITAAEASKKDVNCFKVVYIRRDINNVVLNEKAEVDVFKMLDENIKRLKNDNMENLI